MGLGKEPSLVEAVSLLLPQKKQWELTDQPQSGAKHPQRSKKEVEGALSKGSRHPCSTGSIKEPVCI